MPPQPSELDRELEVLEVELRKLEGEYNMYFAGRLPRPPWVTRARVAGMVRRLDNAHIPNFADRFRFTALQSRFAAFADLWDRALRAREEGRPGPFRHRGQETRQEPAAPSDRIVHVAAFRDPMKEMDKLHDLYDCVTDARRELGEEALPFHRFAELIRTQVANMRDAGAPEVAFRVAVKDGKLSFTAKGLKGLKTGG